MRKDISAIILCDEESEYIFKRIGESKLTNIKVYTDLKRVREEIEKNKFDIYIIDIDIENNLEGIDIIKSLRFENREAQIIAVSIFQIPSVLHECIKAGVDNYLIKDIYPKKIIDAIEKGIENIDNKREAAEYKKELERKNEILLKESEILSSVLETGMTGVMIVDNNMKIIFWNKKITEIFKINEESLKIKKISYILKENFKKLKYPEIAFEVVKELKKNIKTDKRVIVELKDGKTISVEVKARIKSDEAVGIIIYCRDITDWKKMEEEIVRREKQYRNLVEDMPVLLCRFRSDGNITFLNNAYVSLFGYSIKSKFGITDDSKFQENKDNIMKNYTEGFVNVNRLNYVEKMIIDKNGKECWIQWVDYAICKGKNEICEFQSVGIDITERKRLEISLKQAKEQYQILFENMNDSFAYFKVVKEESKKEIKLEIININEQFEKNTGLKRDEAIGKNILEISNNYKIWVENKIEDIEEVAFKGVRKKSEVYFENLNKWYVVSSFSDKNGYIASIFHDITERKELEEKIQRYNEELRDVLGNLEYRIKERTVEIELLNKNLIKAKEKAEESNRMKSQFLANMSHEFRTPLNGINGMCQLLLDTNMSGEQKEYVNLIKLSEEGLLRIINDILDFAKIDSKKLTFEEVPVNLGEIIKKIKEMFSNDINKKELEMEVVLENPDNVNIVGDPLRYEQILINVVGNAVKFTKNGGVYINLSVKILDNGYVNVVTTIKDTGIGIKEDKVGDIFSSFIQEDSSFTREYGGTGLGLAIAKELSQMMGGDLILKSSKIGVGSCFEFNCKFKNFSKELMKSINPRDRFEKGIINKKLYIKETTVEIDRIDAIVVEGNIVNQKIMEKILNNNGVKNIITKSSKEAVDILKKYGAKTIFIDSSIKDINLKIFISEIRDISKRITVAIMRKQEEELEGFEEEIIITKPLKEENVIMALKNREA